MVLFQDSENVEVQVFILNDAILNGEKVNANPAANPPPRSL